MRCSCGHENRPGAKFCEECAAPLARACASCGSELRPSAKFCDECGTPASGAAPTPRPADARKVVSIVFADLVGSTALHERLDPESAQRFMESYYDAMRGAVESHGGTVTQLLGDGVKAVFGIPRVAEDDAIRAVRAAVAMQDAFRALADAQRGAVGATGLRVAVNTGEVVANDATEIIGDPVNVAARLQEQGKDGDVVVGESTHRLVSTRVTLELLGSFALKGRSEAVKAYRVVSLDRPAGAATAPFVGRADELTRLATVYETAVEKPAASLAVLVGSPGLGKSRLIDEFALRSGASATVIRAHCDAAGGATFAPIAQALRELLGVDDGASAEALRAAIESALPDDSDRTRIAGGVAALLSGSPASPEETFFIVRRLLAALAQTRPVVLVIDDLHWAEPLLLDLVEHLIQWGSGVSLFVLIGARPELRELRSSLVIPGGLVSDVVTLSGLDAGAAMRLAANVIGASDLPAAVAAKVLATSEGNPLFVGELVRMLVQEGALTREGDRWTVGAKLAALEMPPTIHALLAARIERLRSEERTVLERAAVVGRHFSRSAIAALMPGGAGDLDARLEALRRSELIERDTGWLLGEPVLRFHHVLIRDAAYRRLLKGTRAELHAKLADWIEAQAGDAAEHDETIGWHLEQAHQFLRELGPLDDAGNRLGERAATRLAAAGRRALARDDLPVASDLLGRAITRLDAGDPVRADLALDWCEALLASGDVGPAAAAIGELGRFTADSDRLRAWHTCFTGQHTVLTAPSALHATVGAVATAADELTALGDAAGEAKAHFVHALALSRLGKVGACEAALDRALAAARRASDRRRANTVLAIAPLAALWGPSPVTRASGRCLDVVRVLRITQGAPAVEAVALSCQGVLEALRGRTAAARRMIASARKMVEELGITQRLLEADVSAGLVALLEGDAPAAERGLRGAYDGLRDLGLRIDAARAAALLARALLALGRVEEAEALSHESESLAGDDLKAAIAWRGVRAEALARRGEHAEAVALASKAVELAAATDALLDHADARLALAAALRAAGAHSDADGEERRARDLWQAKGATLLAERAPQPAAPVAPPIAAPRPRAALASRRRPVRPNYAFEAMRRAEVAVTERDARALESLYRRDIEVVDHQFDIAYGYDAIVARVRTTIEESPDGAFAHDVLATLGDHLALGRLRSTASGSTVYGTAVGATATTYLLVIEADEQSGGRRIEIFGEDKLGDAVVRLYERHAELTPEGPERERAAAVAFALGSDLLAPLDAERIARGHAAEFESIDHRHLSGWSVRGRDGYLEHIRALQEVATDVAMSVDDVLALGPGAILVRRVHSGTDRKGGGRYERPFLSLFATDAAGHLARVEWWDADREAEALARFDAVTADASEPRPSRRVRPNAATRTTSLYERAMANHDIDALDRILSAQLEVVHHPTGSTYGRAELLESWRSMFGASTMTHRFELLAGLGEHLCLGRSLFTIDGAHGLGVDPGLAEVEIIHVFEVDDVGLLSRSEVFGGDRLGDAVSRCYELYAAQWPAGAARTRAEATARSVSLVAPGGLDRDRYTAAFRSDVEIVDRKLLGLGSGVGLATLFRSMATTRELGDQLVAHPQDVFALTHDALLLGWRTAGVGRESGGPFEWAFLRLFLFDPDGRVARYELFEDDREAEALARFEALVAKPGARRRVRANTATRSTARFIAALEARDADALPAFFDHSLRVIHHPSGSAYGRREMLATWRSALRADRLEFRGQPIASLRDTLVLNRQVTAVEGLRESHLADFGSTEVDEISLIETDADGRWIHVELFAPDRLGDAIVRLYERWADLLPEGSTRARAAAVARAAVAVLGPIDLDRMAAAFAADLRLTDHRVLATWSAESGAELVEQFRHHLELAPDFAPRVDAVLAVEPDALIARITYVGTARDSGGSFENRTCNLFVFGDDGRIARVECYEAEQEADALACFDALTSGGKVAAVEHPFANAASRTNRRRADAFNARDWAGVEACVSPDLVFDERRRLSRNVANREAWLAQTRILFDLPESRFEIELLATRGERLSLHLHRFAGALPDGGGLLALDDHLALHEVDRDGRIALIVLFDRDDEVAAYAELDARFDAGEGAAHARTLAVWRRFERGHASRDWDSLGAARSPGLVFRDHRLLGWGDTASDWVSVDQITRSLVDLAPDVHRRHDHVRLCERGLLEQMAQVGTRDGGAFESVFLAVYEWDAQGRLQNVDNYDAARFDLAWARFADIAASVAAKERFANAATRSGEQNAATWMAAAWEHFATLFPADARLSDRRRAVQLELGRDELIAFSRSLGEHATTRIIQIETLATRGEGLALQRWRIELAGDEVGPSEICHLTLIDRVEQSPRKPGVRWDDDAIDAAWAELDARFEAGEGAAHPHALAAHLATNAAIRTRDWDALAALCAPTFWMRDHRLLAGGTLVNDAATFVRVIRSAIELAPDSSYRHDHVRICARGTLAGITLCGTRDGGAFENKFLRVTEVDEHGRILSHDVYDESDYDRALARFAEIPAPAAPKGRFENVASRAWRSVNDAWTARDLGRFAAPHAAALRYRDHRRLFQLELDRPGFLDFTRPLLTMRAGDASLDLVATRGEQLALMHSVMRMEDDTVGPSVIESLMLIETDERGDIAAYDRWDLEDEDAAWAEIAARWTAGEGTQRSDAPTLWDTALARRDWDAASACYAPNFVGHDHRLVSWGTVHGPSAVVRTVQEMVALAPDARMRTNHVRAHGRGSIRDVTWLGTREGGAFESAFVTVTEQGADGRIVRADFYDPHHLDSALARFAEIRASERRVSVAAATAQRNAENAAIAAIDRWQETYAVALETGDFEPMRALCAPGFVFDDCQRLALVSGDRDFFLASARERVAMGARPLHTLVGTAGDRVVIQTMIWSGGPADGRFEIENIVVGECDESGLLTAIVLFDSDDLPAAQREAWSRWAAIEPDAAPWITLLGEITDAWNAHDPARLRASMAEDVVVEDHRHVSIGRVEGADAYVPAQVALWDLAPDQRIAFGGSFLASHRNGFVTTLERSGTLAEGGEFAVDYVWLALVRNGRLTRVELFEDDAKDEALARFEALRPDPDALAIPPNAATGAIGRITPLYSRADPNALRAIVSDDFVFDDRTRGSLLRGSAEEWVSGLLFLRTETRAQLDRRVVATAGDRLALSHLSWRETPGESSFLIERFGLYEIDATGKLRTFVLFDADDRAAAHTELFDRYVALGADGMPACMVELVRAIDARDLDRMRAVLADDFVYHDRRRTGSGQLDGPDAYLASPRAWWALSGDARMDLLYTVDSAPHGRVTVNRMAGTNHEGGDFESFMVTLVCARGERIAVAELFEIDQLDAALARLEELRPDPLRIPLTAATRMRDRHRDAFVARDWDAMRALTGADFVYDDRGKRALVRGDVETWIASMEFTTQSGFRSESTLLGTFGGRIVLDQLRWFGKADDGAFEFERVRLLEVGADGLLRAVLFFDPDDRAAAFAEAGERFRAGEAAGCPAQGAVDALFGVWRNRDWAAARALLTDVAAIRDHRRLGFGDLTPEAWGESWRVGVELAPDVRGETIRVLAWNDHGRVTLLRVTGTRDGGAFESVLVTVVVAVAGRIGHFEFFEADDAERALARFEELCARRS